MKKQASYLAAVIAIALVAAPSAAAHAILLSTSPGNDSVLQASPKVVQLGFNEPVESAFGSIRVYDSQARRVDDGHVSRPDERTVRVAIPRRLARGTYTTTWRVVSADSHPVSGAFVFHVGAPGANPSGVAAEVSGGGTPRAVRVLRTVDRFFDFALLLLVVGGAVALAYPLRSLGAALRRRLVFVLAIWAALLAVAALAGIVFQGADAGGFGLGEAVHWNNITAVLDTRFGKVWLFQAGLAAAVSLFALGTSKVPLLPVLALAPTPSLSGHASASGGLALLADVAHVVAAALWIGGLAFVVVAVLAAGPDRWPLATRAVPRFSKLAVVSVPVLIVAGVVNGYEQVGAWRGLWDTTYGLLLLAKIGLVLPVLALGTYNNRYAVPRLREEIASAVEQRRFLRMAGAELAVVVAIVGVTSVLVGEPPAKASVAPKGPFGTTVELGPLEANVVVDPATAGTNVVHVYLTTRSGRPADVAELNVSASLPSRSLGPLRFGAHPFAPGHYAVHGAQLALAGDWQFRIEARRGEFELLTATTSIPIRTES